MDADIAIRAQGVGRKYCPTALPAAAYRLRDMIGTALRRPRSAELRPGEFWALRDVAFEIARGECLGVLGRNGAGKSTLLRALGGRIELDTGRIEVRGRTVAIAQLGLAFHMELTGRENVLNQAVLLGLGRGAARRRMDEIVDFADIGRFIDEPLRVYSTGMRSRLGFAAACHVDPDVLLIDEVLAVGDFAFQAKCMQRLQKFLHRGGAILLVSHNMAAVQVMCARALVLDAGRVAHLGRTEDAIQQYTAATLSDAPETDGAAHPSGGGLDPDCEVHILSAEIVPAEGADLVTTTPADVVVRYRSAAAAPCVWSFRVMSMDRSISIASAYLGLRTDVRVLPGEGELRCRIRNLSLTAGTYWLQASIGHRETMLPLAMYGFASQPTRFHVREGAVATEGFRRHFKDLVRLDVEDAD